ncbi:hypothetical protein CWR48_14950 [Oceanobacillus arenosus]|uniref:Uncharacterized protein n=2 Tax=Oceanobacillus arenosus TaxID=1229153 RepID=A0A3D8PPT5_9BACI|nr:hypothetical protein CWR48_14950 [Oceanobacillus arenosus]
MTWIQLVIFVLASFRLTRLIVFDSITWFIRKPFMHIVENTDENGKIIRQMAISGTRVRRWSK